MLKKKVTQKQLEANCRNGKKGCGPTEQGKRHSSRNAIILGLFCNELYVAEEDREQFKALKASLEQQLHPRTELQCLAVSRITAAAWRYKLALKNEARYLAQQFSAEVMSVPEPEKPTTTEWYAANPRETANASRLIDILIRAVTTYGRVPEGFVESIKVAFGEEFYKQLVEWETTPIDYLLAAEMMVKKAKMFGFETSLDKLDIKYEEERNGIEDDEEGEEADAEPEQSRDRPGPKPKVIVLRDRNERVDMMVKLLEAKRQHLLDVQRIVRHHNGDSGDRHGSFEPPDRYVTAAARELERAIAWYEHLVEFRL